MAQTVGAAPLCQLLGGSAPHGGGGAYLYKSNSFSLYFTSQGEHDLPHLD